MIITNITFFTGYVLVIINEDFGGRHCSIPNGKEDMGKYGKVKISSKMFFKAIFYIFNSGILKLIYSINVI